MTGRSTPGTWTNSRGVTMARLLAVRAGRSWLLGGPRLRRLAVLFGEFLFGTARC